MKREEFSEIRRAALIASIAEAGAIGLIGTGLFFGAAAISELLVQRYPMLPRTTLASVFFAFFVAALIFAIRSLARRHRAWSDHLKTVVPLERFLTLKSEDAVLAPNLSKAERQEILRQLRVIREREDVLEIRVGLLPDEGNISDRLLIKTFAPTKTIFAWSELLAAETRQVSSYKYLVGGAKRRVRSVLFIWD